MVSVCKHRYLKRHCLPVYSTGDNIVMYVFVFFWCDFSLSFHFQPLWVYFRCLIYIACSWVLFSLYNLSLFNGLVYPTDICCYNRYFCSECCHLCYSICINFSYGICYLLDDLCSLLPGVYDFGFGFPSLMFLDSIFHIIVFITLNTIIYMCRDRSITLAIYQFQVASNKKWGNTLDIFSQLLSIYNTKSL